MMASRTDSVVALHLVRAIIARAGNRADRVAITEIQSTDWRSLTFAGERHQIVLRIEGPSCRATAARILDSIEDAEFNLPRQIVAGVEVVNGPAFDELDRVAAVTIEALTVEQ